MKRSRRSAARRPQTVSRLCPSLGLKLVLRVFRSSSFWVFRYSGQTKHLSHTQHTTCCQMLSSTHGSSCTSESQRSSSRSCQRSDEPSPPSPCPSALRTWSCRREHSKANTCECVCVCVCVCGRTCRCCSSAWPRHDGTRTVCRSRRCCRRWASPRSERSPAQSWYLSTEPEGKLSVSDI